MAFAQAPEAEYPPYLLDFAGSPSERHVENLKVRMMGITCNFTTVNITLYRSSERSGSPHTTRPPVSYIGSDCKLFRNVEEQIQDQFVGPDCYWKNPAERPTPGCTKFFGNGWWIPFPPTLVRHFFICNRFIDIIDLSLNQGHSLR
jgi:hypothetical protein